MADTTPSTSDIDTVHEDGTVTAADGVRRPYDEHIQYVLSPPIVAGVIDDAPTKAAARFPWRPLAAGAVGGAALAVLVEVIAHLV